MWQCQDCTYRPPFSSFGFVQIFFIFSFETPIGARRLQRDYWQSAKKYSKIFYFSLDFYIVCAILCLDSERSFISQYRTGNRKQAKLMTEVKQVEKQQREQQEVARNAKLDLSFEKMLLAITTAFSNSDNKKDKLLLLLILNSLEKHSMFDNEQPRPLTYARERIMHDVGYEIYELAYCLSVFDMNPTNDDDRRADTIYDNDKLTVNY